MKLKENLKKILYYIFLPLIAILSLLKLLKGHQIEEAKEDIKEASEKDKQLESEIKAFVKKSEKAESKAKDIEKALETLEDDEDWHLKD